MLWAEAKPDLKVDIFGGNEQEVDLNRIQRVAVFRAKSGECLCAATIDGKKLQPRSVSPSQWQRLWVAPDRDSYKQNLAASLFADVLQKDNNVEQSTQEKQEEATEVKQAETAIVDKHDEQKEVVLKEDKSSEQREEKKQEEKKEEKKDEKAVKAAVSPLVQQYLDLKKKHPDAILLFRCGDFYETYKDDAVKASKILGITLTKSNGRKDDEGKPLAMAGFPYHALTPICRSSFVLVNGWPSVTSWKCRSRQHHRSVELRRWCHLEKRQESRWHRKVKKQNNTPV